MKKKRKLTTSILMTVFLVVMSVMPVMAAGSTSTQVYTPVSGDGDECTFTKELVMDADANVPEASFKFTVAAGGAIPADTTAGTLAVIAGPVVKDDEGNVTAPSIADVTFTAGATTTTDTDMTMTSDASSATKTASKKATIDFSGISFPEPGVYRYIITEEASTNSAISNDSEPTRTVDVYVEDNGNNQLAVVDYIMYRGTDIAAPKSTATAANPETTKPNGAEPTGATKTDKYTNTYNSSNLTFGKEVTGNQGSRDKYFKFTVEITGALAGTVYDVDLTNAEGTIPAKPNAATTCITSDVTNPSTLTVADGATTVKATFYLRDGQYVTIKGLANGTGYKVTEDAEDYTATSGIKAENNATIKNADGTSIALSDDTVGTIASADINTGYTNNRSGVIPTGVNMSVLPIVVIGFVVICGIVTLLVKTRKREI